MKPNDQTIIFTDGACISNPDGPGGWGAIIFSNEQVVELGGHEPSTTNNRMEMMAAIEALTKIPHGSNHSLIVYSDSKYVIDGIGWVPGWQRKGWLTADKKPVKNQDLWEKLYEQHSRFNNRIQWKHVPAHRGVPGNERADDISCLYAKNAKPQLFKGNYSSYDIDLLSLSPQFSKKNTQHDELQLQLTSAQVSEESDRKTTTVAESEEPTKLVERLNTEIHALQKKCDMWSKRALKAEADLKALTQHSSLRHGLNSKESFTLITKELLMKNKTDKGGWTKDQIESLGLKWPPQTGWQSEVIGKTISEENLRRFEAKLSVKQSRK